MGWEDSIDEENEEGLWMGVFRSVGSGLQLMREQ